MEVTKNLKPQVKPPLWTMNFILICVATLLCWSNSQFIMPILPKYAIYLGTDRKLVGFISGCFTLSAFLTRPIAGRECDRRGRKVVYFAGLMVLFLGALGNIWANSFAVLLILRLVHGAGWAACSTASNTIASDLIPPERRGEGMGYFGMSQTLAQATAPALSLTLIETTGYDTVFIIAVMFAVAAMLVSLPLKLDTFSTASNKTNRLALFEKRALKVSTLMFFLAVSCGGFSHISPYVPMRGMSAT